MSSSWLFLIGGILRLAYGLGAIFAPEWIGTHVAPTLQGHPDPRMTLRGFGSAHTAIALYPLANATTHERTRSVVGLNARVDALDAGVSLLEWRARAELDRVVAGGIAVNVAGILCWTAAAATLA